MNLSYNHRIDYLSEAFLRKMSLECTKVGGINLAEGLGEKNIPESVSSGGKQAIDELVNQYTLESGLLGLRQKIADKLQKYNGLSFIPDTEIIVTTGATGAFYCSCVGLFEPGDEIFVFEPYYPYHVDILILLGLVPRYLSLEPPNWKLRLADIESLLSSRSRAILINTPANPSGKVFDRDELEVLADFAVKNNLFIISDEIYEYFVFDGRKHMSPATIETVRNQTVTIGGFSKTFNITGWRIGYLACHQHWADILNIVNHRIYACAPAPLQVGSAEGLAKIGDQFYEDLKQRNQAKRDQLCGALEQAGLEPCKPEGGYYILANIDPIPGETSMDKTMNLLSKTGIAAAPGRAFFKNSQLRDTLARFCFAVHQSELDEACNRLVDLK